jgi:hypothetical protein
MSNTWRSWLLAPVHAVALASAAKSFRDNPILGSAGAGFCRKFQANADAARSVLFHPRPHRRARARPGRNRIEPEWKNPI